MENKLTKRLTLSMVTLVFVLTTVSTNLIFAISTYDTDYILVKDKHIDNAIASLIKARYEVIN